MATSIKDSMTDLAPDLAVLPSPNIYARKSAMTADLLSAMPDKKHGQGYLYFSVHHVEQLIAKAGIAHGVDVSPEVITTPDGLACVVTLTNTDDPSDKIVKQFTFLGIPKDPANSYLAKYSYVRLFHLADEEDADATMNTPAPRSVIPPAPRPAQVAPLPVADNAATTTPQQALLRAIKAIPDHGDRQAFCDQFGVEYRVPAILGLENSKAVEMMAALKS